MLHGKGAFVHVSVNATPTLTELRELRDYTFDIFLSVKSDEVFAEWVRDTFIPLFGFYIKEDVRAKCRRAFAGLFFYKTNLGPGDPWPDELRAAIRGSRCAVALCSPEYFYSRYCLTEFHSFLERSRTEKAKVLIPAAVHDGEAFPDEARNIQIADFADFVIVGPGFRETKKFMMLQEKLTKFSLRVAELVSLAPAFKEWPIVEKAAPAQPPTVTQRTL